MFHTAQYGMYAGDRSACEWGTDLKLIIEAIEGTVADVVQDKTNMTLVASNMISPVLEHYDTITKCPLSTDDTDIGIHELYIYIYIIACIIEQTLRVTVKPPPSPLFTTSVEWIVGKR